MRLAGGRGQGWQRLIFGHRVCAGQGCEGFEECACTSVGGAATLPLPHLTRMPPLCEQSYIKGTGRHFMTHNCNPLLNLSLPAHQVCISCISEVDACIVRRHVGAYFRRGKQRSMCVRKMIRMGCQWQLPSDMARPMRCSRGAQARFTRGTEMVLEQPRITGIRRCEGGERRGLLWE